MKAPASGAAQGAQPGASSASAALQDTAPDAQARSEPAAWASKFVTWRKRKAEEAELAELGEKRLGAEAASAPGLALDPNPAAGSNSDTARLQAEVHSSSGGKRAATAPGRLAALPRSAPAPSAAAVGVSSQREDAASGDAFGWDSGAAARMGPGAALPGAAAGSSDVELDSDEPSPSLEDASEDAQGASPECRRSGGTAPASAGGAGAGSAAGLGGPMVMAEEASEGAQRDPGQCLVLLADDSPMAGELASLFADGW